eukprot:CAMPEP_0170240122 /NCGR_PEP_ID=MMETSP0116_2-20130129/19818_1 /TAXON_ID=400756 /ORGANISM="Durinskia baltica, Strain CSIRO CS-38" /LENGTH=176 /DNA_ID=CAMNT_0010490939 /DNA_START=61 /DNA_END=591 /DNA_ORIENTATION=+
MAQVMPQMQMSLVDVRPPTAPRGRQAPRARQARAVQGEAARAEVGQALAAEAVVNIVRSESEATKQTSTGSPEREAGPEGWSEWIRTHCSDFEECPKDLYLASDPEEGLDEEMKKQLRAFSAEVAAAYDAVPMVRWRELESDAVKDAQVMVGAAGRALRRAGGIVAPEMSGHAAEV